MKTTDLYQVVSGEVSNPKLKQIRAKDKLRDEKIKYLSDKLNIEAIDAAEFLEQMCESSIVPSVGMQASFL